MAALLTDANRDVFEQVRARVLGSGETIIIDSPPGAGKTEMALQIAQSAVAERSWRVMVVTPQVAQTYDVTARLSRRYPDLSVQLLHASGRELPRLANNGANVGIVSQVSALVPGPGVTVSTAAKLIATLERFVPDQYDLLLFDEAYQLTYRDFAPLTSLAPIGCLIGDPGQLAPTIRVDTSRFESAARVHWPAPKELRRRFPELPVLQMPVSRRLPADTVRIIQPSLYPDLRFRASSRRGERRVRFGVRAGPEPDAIDRALDLIAGGASIVGVLLPAREERWSSADEELAELGATVAQRLLQREITWRGVRRLQASDIGYLDPHVVSGYAARRALEARGLSTLALRVNTTEAWQGLERPVAIVRHPLSGLTKLSEFDLDRGRWCVMLSRHQLCAVIVGREGIATAIEEHQHTGSSRMLGTEDREWRGWRAHRAIWQELERLGRIIRISV